MGKINFYAIARKNPMTKAVAYHAQKTSYGIGRIETAELVDYIAKNSQLPRAVVPAALAAIQKSIYNFVLNGHSVTVPRLGVFTCTFKGIASDTEKEVTGEKVERINIRFRPCSALREQLTYGISYNKVRGHNSVEEDNNG